MVCKERIYFNERIINYLISTRLLKVSKKNYQNVFNNLKKKDDEIFDLKKEKQKLKTKLINHRKGIF